MEIERSLLYADESVAVINKPAGLRAIPDGYDPALPHLSGMLQGAFGRVWVVHRLDKDTSGVMVFALSAEAHRELNRQFEERETCKEYHAIVTGMPEFESTVIQLPLRVDGDRRHRTVIDHQTGKPAETAAALVLRLGVFALIEAVPHTGYTHQIRAHLAAIDLPLLADPLYKSLRGETEISRRAAAIAPSLPIRRTALHAQAITFTHPLSGQTMRLSAPYPDDFAETLALLSASQEPE